MAKTTMLDAPKMERKATIKVDVPKESKGKMDMKGMEMGKEMSMMCKGKITRISDDEFGKSMEMEMSSMEMMGKGGGSMGEDMKKVEKSRMMKMNEV